jgi:hypothetical protein
MAVGYARHMFTLLHFAAFVRADYGIVRPALNAHTTLKLGSVIAP